MGVATTVIVVLSDPVGTRKTDDANAATGGLNGAVLRVVERTVEQTQSLGLR